MPTGLAIKQCCCAGEDQCYKITPLFAEGTGCSFYDAVCGSTPDTFTVALSSIVLEPGTTDCPGPETSWTINPSVGPNGLFRLPQSIFEPCFYRVLLESAGRFTQGVVDYDITLFEVSLFVFETTILVNVAYGTGFGSPFAPIFTSTVALGCGVLGIGNQIDLVCRPQFQGDDWTRAATGGGLGLIIPGDIANDVRCPGGLPIIVDNDLSAFVGRVITITEDGQDVCYSVITADCVDPVTLDPEVIATIVDCSDNFQDCCDDNCD